MFIGEYTHTLDSKGRLAIPVKFRADLAKGAVVTRGLDGCLFVYSLGEWKKLAQKLMALPLSQANSRAFSRLMLAGAMDVELDKQGRIIIPEYLRKFAVIKKKMVVAGLYNRIELWNEEKWEEYKKDTESQGESIIEHLGEVGVF